MGLFYFVGNKMVTDNNNATLNRSSEALSYYISAIANEGIQI